LKRVKPAQVAVNRIKNIVGDLVVVARNTREALNRSPTANLIYYRGKAFIRSTFIYDLCVTEGHIVIGGLFEFLI
jgi:hypothetical protein